MFHQQSGAATNRHFSQAHHRSAAALPPSSGSEDFPDYILPLNRAQILSDSASEAAATERADGATDVPTVSNPAFAAVSLDEIILHSMEFIRHLAERRGTSVSVAIARRLPLVCCDLAATRCLIANLLIRAIKYGDPHRFSVFVCAYVGGSQDTVEVSITHSRRAPSITCQPLESGGPANESDGPDEHDLPKEDVVEDAEQWPALSLDDLPNSPQFGRLQLVRESGCSQTYRLSLPIQPS